MPINSGDATVVLSYTATEHEITNCNYKLEEEQVDRNEKKGDENKKERNKCVAYYPTGIGFIFMKGLNSVVPPFILDHQLSSFFFFFFLSQWLIPVCSFPC